MKQLKDYLISESYENDFNFNISIFDNGKLEWVNLYKKIIKSIKSEEDTNLEIDGGRLGTINVIFYNKSVKSKSCDLRIAMKDLSKHVKLENEGDEVIFKNESINDAIIKMQNIINKLKKVL